ncbi:hypothetical protein [uncultured Clostridium sp.]|uniref:hypothetical protein n=1 Tax=uncultured Clostridium sp. TaxID=59620 RepID=UPI0028ECB8D3|nr:hypothetical protein [uncultured Clostridium sp.]
MDKIKINRIKTLLKAKYSKGLIVFFLMILWMLSFFIAYLLPYEIGESFNQELLFYYYPLSLICWSFVLEGVRLKEGSKYLRLGIIRKDFLITSMVIENIIIFIMGFFISSNIFILIEGTSLSFLGFFINRSLIGILKLTLLNYIFINFSIGLGRFLFIILDKFIFAWIKGLIYPIIYFIFISSFMKKFNYALIQLDYKKLLIPSIAIMIVINLFYYKIWLKKDLI